MIATLHFHSKLSGKYERSFSLYRLFFPEKLEKVRVYWRLSLISPDLVSIREFRKWILIRELNGPFYKSLPFFLSSVVSVVSVVVNFRIGSKFVLIHSTKK